MKVMGCDVGGTNVRVRVAACASHHAPTVIAEQQFRSAAYPGLESLLAEFLAAHGLGGDTIAQTCVALAGPVQRFGAQQRCQLTNLPWMVDNIALGKALGLPRVELLNDFEAVGYGLETLQDADLMTLQEGEPLAQAPRALIGAGTGLGQALLIWHHDGYRVLATEGGHADFAPADELQLALLQHLRAQLYHVSFEDVLSGPGLERIYRFLEHAGDAAVPELARREEQELAAAIGAAALVGEHALAVQAVGLFLRIYGAQAGNLALTAMARGGVYIAGGIAPKLSEIIVDSGFLPAFHDKGRMAPLMSRFPVRLVRAADVGLRGATQLACRRLRAPT